ncbi:putative FBD domain-containing protein [Rosa chinensis]|uniref:Putative FBD domain-containing protein n=1 Tax=Rosa chinensis TaxID=74649 RepID=A0A2P6RC44_ROSCH|nr:putative FBD domain-containing protein [Rosa chinensis]
MCCGFNMGYWKLQNTAFIYQLKEVTIELSHGSNGIEFASYILDHAQNLNKMTIVHSPQQSKAMSKLKKSKMASNITLDFQEDEKKGPPE